MLFPVAIALKVSVFLLVLLTVAGDGHVLEGTQQVPSAEEENPWMPTASSTEHIPDGVGASSHRHLQEELNTIHCTRTYVVRKSDTCRSIILHYFKGNSELLSSLNGGFVCINQRLFPGLTLCIPWW
eukprot:TRINITY_DN5460_c0_g3_i2.p1 TRINITY_DN5460_c0_g3~~TRINITY_DN5460_c0_g3_i2.p1  ORF type:complete len:127 (+),score=16.03 TRINITY_DN5460_c0_g3_i2:86-466(+)